MTAFEETFPHVQVTGNADRTLTVEQEQFGNLQRVALHAVHVRFMAEQLGLLPALSVGAPADRPFDEQAPVLLADRGRMVRALLRVRLMSSELAQSLDFIANRSDEDLSHSVGQAGELSDFVAFICEDFERAQHAPASPPVSTSTSNTPPIEGAAA